MSTRSVVAYPYGDGWQGTYVHSDGYPAGVGLSVIEQVKMFGGAGVRKLIQATPEGFSSFPEMPYTDGNMVYSAEDEQDNSALHIEWVYVVSERGVVTILESVEDVGADPYLMEGYGGTTFTQPRYRWEIVGQIDCRASDADAQMRALSRRAEAA